MSSNKNTETEVSYYPIPGRNEKDIIDAHHIRRTGECDILEDRLTVGFWKDPTGPKIPPHNRGSFEVGTYKNGRYFVSMEGYAERGAEKPENQEVLQILINYRGLPGEVKELVSPYLTGSSPEARSGR